ncbi:MFS transporter, partial [Streptomyces alfalfae]
MALVMKQPVEKMEQPYGRRWWALGVLCLSLLIIVMANTALTVAAPDMTKDLGLSSSDLQWVIDGYTCPLYTCDATDENAGMEPVSRHVIKT